MFYTLSRFILGLFFKIFFRYSVFGRENFPKEGGIIVASNHASFFDPIIIGVGAPRKLIFLAREDLFKPRIFGKILNWCQVYPLKRDGADLRAFKLAIKKLKEGKPVLVFPEGTRSVNGELQEPKHGIGFLQITTGERILPCYVKGSMDAWPRHSRFPRPGPVSVYFGKPLVCSGTLEGNKDKRYDHIAGQVMAAIAELKEESKLR